MKQEHINLSEHYNKITNASFDVIFDFDFFDRIKMPKLPAVVICAGGAYGMTSKREKMPVALEFMNRGYIAVILHYTTDLTHCYPTQLYELFQTVDYLKKNEGRLGIDSNRIYLVGFSVGGHLVCNYGVEYHNYLKDYDLNIKALCLCYPVITEEYGLCGRTFKNLLYSYSLEKQEEMKKNFILIE